MGHHVTHAMPTKPPTTVAKVIRELSTMVREGPRLVVCMDASTVLLVAPPYPYVHGFDMLAKHARHGKETRRDETKKAAAPIQSNRDLIEYRLRPFESQRLPPTTTTKVVKLLYVLHYPTVAHPWAVHYNIPTNLTSLS
jgi:hypothetical protein